MSVSVEGKSSVKVRVERSYFNGLLMERMSLVKVLVSKVIYQSSCGRKVIFQMSSNRRKVIY